MGVDRQGMAVFEGGGLPPPPLEGRLGREAGDDVAAAGDLGVPLAGDGPPPPEHGEGHGQGDRRRGVHTRPGAGAPGPRGGGEPPAKLLLKDGGGGVQPSPSRQPSLDEKGSLGTPPPMVSEKRTHMGVFFSIQKQPTSLSVNFFLFYMFRIT